VFETLTQESPEILRSAKTDEAAECALTVRRCGVEQDAAIGSGPPLA
jgi:hypothetical protein